MHEKDEDIWWDCAFIIFTPSTKVQLPPQCHQFGFYSGIRLAYIYPIHTPDAVGTLSSLCFSCIVSIPLGHWEIPSDT